MGRGVRRGMQDLTTKDAKERRCSKEPLWSVDVGATRLSVKFTTDGWEELHKAAHGGP